MSRRSLILLFLFLTSLSQTVFAISFDLDTLASKGKFMRFCVNSYQFANKFLNEIDTAYVAPTGYKWNVKIRASSWTEFNDFYLDGNHRMGMMSPFSTSIGADVQFMAVAVGYDFNVNKLFGGKEQTKSRFNFEFSSARLSGRFYSIKNDDGMDIKYIDRKRVHGAVFPGVSSSTWGIDLTYYFNNLKYSNQAAFSFGKIQKKSQGSFMAGLAFQKQKLLFDFNQLPENVDKWMEGNWKEDKYKLDGFSIGISGGYGYNWVVRRKFTFGVMWLAIPALHYGYLNSDDRGYSFRLNYRLNGSAVWNHNRWFIGTVVRADAGFVFSRSLLTNGLFNWETKLGMRF